MEKCESDRTCREGTQRNNSQDIMKEWYSLEAQRDPEGDPLKVLDVAVFFQSSLKAIADAQWYTEAEYQTFLSWHQPWALVEKIIDAKRFFRIIRHDGKIVGFFESRNTEDSIHVQWIFIDIEHQRRKLSHTLWREFWEHAKKQEGTKTVKSFVKISNHISVDMHVKQGFTQKEVTENTITFERVL